MTTRAPDANERTVRRIPTEVATRGNLDAMDEIFAGDVVDHTPMGEFRGRAAAREQFRQLRAAFPDLEVTVGDASPRTGRSPCA